MRRVMLLAIVALNLFRFTPLRADGPLLPNKLQVITVTNAAQVQALATYKTPADPDQILFTDNSDNALLQRGKVDYHFASENGRSRNDGRGWGIWL